MNSQVLGITNYSHWGDAATMRQCVWESDHVRDLMSGIALVRGTGGGWVGGRTGVRARGAGTRGGGGRG